MKKIRLRNVKAFKDTGEIELAPLTLLVGQNSCGKSSLLRFPVVVSQSSFGTICLHSSRDETIDYGNFRDVVYNHEGNEFSFELIFDSKYRPIIKGAKSVVYSDIIMPLTLKLVVLISQDETSGATYTKSITFMANDETLYTLHATKASDELPFGNDDDNNTYLMHYQKRIVNGTFEDVDYKIKLHDVYFNSFIPRIIRQEAEISFLTDYLNKSKEEAKEYIESNIAEELSYFATEHFSVEVSDQETIASLNPFLSKSQQLEFEEFKLTFAATEDISSILQAKVIGTYQGVSYIGPFRKAPQRIYRRDEKTWWNVGVDGSAAINILINSARSADKEILLETSKWLKDTFGTELVVEEIGNEFYQILLKEKDGVSANIMDVGYGYSQVLPIATQIALLSKKKKSNYKKPDYDTNVISSEKISVIEQPELHLHPKAQAQLGNLFANVITNANSTFLIETHSEHLIRKLQEIIADPSQSLTSSMVKIYYVDRIGNESQIKEMKMDEYGQFLEKWPSGFFDKAYSLTSSMMSHIRARKQEEAKGK